MELWLADVMPDEDAMPAMNKQRINPLILEVTAVMRWPQDPPSGVEILATARFRLPDLTSYDVRSQNQDLLYNYW